MLEEPGFVTGCVSKVVTYGNNRITDIESKIQDTERENRENKSDVVNLCRIG